MAHGSSIEWTEATWNPVVGCTKVSSGCANCYAERMSNRLAAMARSDVSRGRDPGRKSSYLHVIDDRGRWNNSVFLVDGALDAPKHWRSPRVIFVNSMSDLFHEDVPADFIASAFEVMQHCPQHTFQVLTKRPERARDLADDLPWPGNVWLGTSVEDRSVIGRIRQLAEVPASVRFLSVEPLLGPLPGLHLAGVDWVIVGGESGPGSRPVKIAWVREIRDRCVQHGVPFFFKQWGGTNKKRAGRILDDRTWDEMPVRRPRGESDGSTTR